MSEAKNILSEGNTGSSIKNEKRSDNPVSAALVPVMMDAVSDGTPATLIPTTGNYRSISKSRSFAVTFLLMTFYGGAAGFASGIILTTLILQGKLDFDKSAIKAILRTLSGH